MTHYRPYVFFVILVAAGLAALFLVTRGYYPIAIVQNDFISAKKFAAEYSAASLYYQNFIKTYKLPLKDASALKDGELEASVLGQLVEESLIESGAKREVGADLDAQVQSKLGKYENNADLTKAAAALYGLNKDGFWRAVMIPQATREILDAKLSARGEKIDDWIAAQKKSARVIIFSPQFEWNGERVESK